MIELDRYGNPRLLMKILLWILGVAIVAVMVKPEFDKKPEPSPFPSETTAQEPGTLSDTPLDEERITYDKPLKRPKWCYERKEVTLPVHKTICDSQSLCDLDEEKSEAVMALDRLYINDPSQQKAMKQKRAYFRKDRDTCQDRAACITKEYQDFIAELKAEYAAKTASLPAASSNQEPSMGSPGKDPAVWTDINSQQFTAFKNEFFYPDFYSAQCNRIGEVEFPENGETVTYTLYNCANRQSCIKVGADQAGRAVYRPVLMDKNKGYHLVGPNALDCAGTEQVYD